MLVRCLNMSVSADDSGDFSVEKTAHGDFLTGGFAMHINDDVHSPFAHLRHRCFDSAERVFQNWLHERACLHIDDADFALGRFQDDRSAPWRTVGVIHRTQ